MVYFCKITSKILSASPLFDDVYIFRQYKGEMRNNPTSRQFSARCSSEVVAFEVEASYINSCCLCVRVGLKTSHKYTE